MSERPAASPAADEVFVQLPAAIVAEPAGRWARTVAVLATAAARQDQRGPGRCFLAPAPQVAPKRVRVVDPRVLVALFVRSASRPRHRHFPSAAVCRILLRTGRERQALA